MPMLAHQTTYPNHNPALTCAVWARVGFSVQALTTGEGALGSLAKFASNFAPELLQEAEEALGVV